MRQPDRPKPIRLAFARLFWRLWIPLSIALALALWLWLAWFAPPGLWTAAFLFFLPVSTGAAFFLATVATMIADLVVRLLVAPRMLAWVAPTLDELTAPFPVRTPESVIAETPARTAEGRRWPAGRLVLTDRRLIFEPRGWDGEPWSAPLDRLLGCSATESPWSFGRLVQGVPPILEVIADGEPPRRLALADAAAWASLVAEQVGTSSSLSAGAR